MNPPSFTLVWCPVCGRNNKFGRTALSEKHEKHYVKGTGEVCSGRPVSVRYEPVPSLDLALAEVDRYITEHVLAVAGISASTEQYGVFSTNGHRIMALKEVRDRIVKAGIRHYEEQGR